ncbi:membrane fusion protein, Cu(I)/Ag(I) efflux system [Catalinimonas alkaloidigena]|uniref:Membrane fusion protein, Cu(I)/Ag(I) efflux system n=2 Tax=Catalinimonas alkaloidigena TaxID=1075417 RepID=A0A1G9VM94_9BACT|nr:membrane fusion protein, Cu(I)/Ag(I) efflux system [Catalinimonas alkaloidigena]
MHPQIREEQSGQCPICGMDLIPLTTLTSTGDPDAVSMSEAAMRLAQVQTSIVGQPKVVKTIRLNGKIQPDERAVSTQSAHLPGRIERLLINFTGEAVRRGQPVAQIYSPSLLTAQRELIEAQKFREADPDLYRAAREKLRLWKLSEGQINAIAQGQEVKTVFPVYADVSGVVWDKMVNVGDYVERGAPLYKIADLSRVWALFDAYESDLQWIHTGDQVQFTVASLPGRTFTGQVDYIDPVINSQTRAAQVRIVMPNVDGLLKPEMFATASLQAQVDRTKSTVVVPRSAVLWTGERAVVYVRDTASVQPQFRMQQVTLGSALEDSYVVTEGLVNGQEIVTNGTFAVDAAAQLANKPSMMNPGRATGDSSMPGMNMPSDATSEQADFKNTQIPTQKFVENQTIDFRNQVPSTFTKQLQEVVDAYSLLKEALVEANEQKTAQYSTNLLTVLNMVNDDLLSGEAKAFWVEKKTFLLQHAQRCEEVNTLAEKRNNFIYLSQSLIKVVEAFGAGKTLYVAYCPMANDSKGAYWLSEVKTIRNPFMGEAMLTCGTVKDVLD